MQLCIWTTPWSRVERVLAELDHVYRVIIVPKLGERGARCWIWSRVLWRPVLIVSGAFLLARGGGAARLWEAIARLWEKLGS